MRSRVHLLGDDAGFSLIELLVAITVLIVGLLGTFALVQTANGANARSRAREGATNMAREVLEDARVLPFRGVSTGAVAGLLPSLPGYTAMTSPTAATVTRRNIPYAVSVGVCSLDDSGDGVGPHVASITWCSDNPAAGTVDGQPEDYKRITATVSFTQQGTSVTVHQVSTVNSAGAAVGTPVVTLAITSPAVADPTAPVIGPNNRTATFVATTAAAVQSMTFSVDGADQPVASVTSNAAKTQWTFTWQIPVTMSDGDYDISARTVDQLGVQGQRRSLTVTLAEGVMSQPHDVVAGWNSVWETGGTAAQPAIELDWDANPERNVTGYTVTGPNGNTITCPYPSLSPADPTRTWCVDTTAASSSSLVYQVAAVYSNPLAATGTMTGPATAVTITKRGAPTYALGSTTANTATAACAGTTTKNDLVATYTGSASFAPGKTNTALWCSATGQSDIGSGTGSLTLSFDNGSKTGQGFNCSVGYEILLNGSPLATPIAVAPNTAQAFSMAAGASGSVTKTFAVGAQTFAATDQLMVRLTTDSGCNALQIYYGGALTLPAGPGWSSPSPPTGLTVTPQADGSRLLQWTAPATSSPAVSFFRIYRDGKTYESRIDTTGSTNGVLDTSYTDTKTGGTSHTYYVTAVSYCTAVSPSLSCSPGLAESPLVGPVTG
jgi:type II secretory pathway pseudopilin PulG